MNDPFEETDAANARAAQRAALERHRRTRDHRRGAEPLPEGGLWDETAQRQQELFGGRRCES